MGVSALQTMGELARIAARKALLSLVNRHFAPLYSRLHLRLKQIETCGIFSLEASREREN
jgi:hypothetical protein